MCSSDVLKEKIDRMEKKLDKLEDKMDEDRKENTDWHRALGSKIDDLGNIMTAFILKAETTFISKKEVEDKYAGKLTEKIVYSLAGIIWTSVMWAILFLVLK